MTTDHSELIVLKDRDWLEQQKYAGKAAVNALKSCVVAIQNHTPNLRLKDLEGLAEKQLFDMRCAPTFFNHKGYPGKICTSVNNALVHGIPSDYKLKDGDVVSIDLGATYRGTIADVSYTCVYGDTTDKIKLMLLTCQKALKNAIMSIEVGKRIGIIGSTIYKTVKNTPFGLITEFGGHGIDYDSLHAPPFVSNKARSNEGIRIQPGLSIAIEPMLVLTKNTHHKTLSDKWTIVTKDIGCHFEHSITIDENNNVNVITEHGMEICE